MSRFHHVNRSRKTRGDSRTIPLRDNPDYGGGLDDGKYWRCWNCHYICNVERDELGDDASKDGISYEVYDSFDNDAVYKDAATHEDKQLLLKLASIRSGHVLLQNNADGEPKTIRTNWTPVVAAGCPYCGTLNWRGDY